jgi:glycine reductase
MKVVHYLNQFFAGIGGEEHADMPPEARPGALGPGRLLNTLLPEGSQIAASVICGDNYAAQRLEEVQDFVVATAKDAGADLVVAGPCFQAGRYGTAAGAVCAAVQAQLKTPSITGIAAENPGTDLYRQKIRIVDSGQDPARMRSVLARMADLGTKLVNKEPIGRPSEEGYFPQGILKSEFVEETAAQRLARMLLAKLKGLTFESEAPAPTFQAVTPPPAVPDLSKAAIALVTDGGLVPAGNPDKFTRAFSRAWGAYSIKDRNNLEEADYEVVHGGYDIGHVQADPDRLVPVDVLREMEQEGLIGRLHHEFMSTTGNVNPLENSRRLGREIAARLKDANVDAVILTST